MFRIETGTREEISQLPMFDCGAFKMRGFPRSQEPIIQNARETAAAVTAVSVEDRVVVGSRQRTDDGDGA